MTLSTIKTEFHHAMVRVLCLLELFLMTLGAPRENELEIPIEMTCPTRHCFVCPGEKQAPFLVSLHHLRPDPRLHEVAQRAIVAALPRVNIHMTGGTSCSLRGELQGIMASRAWNILVSVAEEETGGCMFEHAVRSHFP
jgi:hypothetical protein